MSNWIIFKNPLSESSRQLSETALFVGVFFCLQTYSMQFFTYLYQFFYLDGKNKVVEINAAVTNTYVNGAYSAPKTMNVKIEFVTPMALTESGTAPYNPFIVVSGIRGQEITCQQMHRLIWLINLSLVLEMTIVIWALKNIICLTIIYIGQLIFQYNLLNL